jgi:hypothetical protein
MTITYNVRIHQTEIVSGVRGNSYRVRWAVDRRRWKKPFKWAALAESFRSELVAASRKGQAFDTATGLPVVAAEVARGKNWYVFACSYADMKWPESAGKSRMGIAETMATVTPVLVEGRGRPPEREMRAALYGWAFNSRARAKADPPPEFVDTIRWLEKHSVPVSELAKPDVLRSVLTRISRKLDGSPAAASTVGRKRAVFHNALEYAVERDLLAQNPLTALKTKKSRTAEAVDKRVVVSPDQALRLLDAVRGQG